MKQTTVPDWLQSEESYEPITDKSKFIDKTRYHFLSVLGKIRMQSEFAQKQIPSVGGALFLLLELIFMVVLSRKLPFLFAVFGLEIILLATFSGKAIKAIVLEMFSGAAFAFLFALPAAIMGNTYTMQMLVLKTSITVCAVAFFSNKIPLYQLSQSLGKFKVFHTILFILDITLKYLVVLGRICTQMTEAVSLRYIGKNTKKQKTAAGVLGMTYLKSQRMTKEMYQAMTCRGFDGTYRSYSSHKLNGADIILILLALGLAVLYFLV